VFGAGVEKVSQKVAEEKCLGFGGRVPKDRMG
jgi:hypothetical protein